jgi:hypothetical protein
VAFRAFGGLGEFLDRKFKAAATTAGWFHDGLVVGMLETAQEMIQVIGNLARRFIH